jgi:hypothetical protein
MKSHLIRRVLGVTIVASATLGVLSSAAFASTTPPVPSTALFGTWVNTNSATRSVKQIVVQPGRDNGGLLVDAFGACTPSLCEWGLVPAIVYGPDVSAKTGATFQTDQAFLSGSTEWARTQLQASVRVTAKGTKSLSVRELTAFEDGSGRHNYTVTETFVPGQGLPATISGNTASGYPFGLPPNAAARLAGDWKAVSNAVVELKIGITSGVPDVHAFGACSPTPCDMGVVRGITYGPNVSATIGKVVLAPYSFGFKNEQVVIAFVAGTTAATDRLVVKNYNEFADGSGRSNYVVTETFTRV